MVLTSLTDYCTNTGRLQGFIARAQNIKIYSAFLQAGNTQMHVKFETKNISSFKITKSNNLSLTATDQKKRLSLLLVQLDI